MSGTMLALMVSLSASARQFSFPSPSSCRETQQQRTRVCAAQPNKAPTSKTQQSSHFMAEKVNATKLKYACPWVLPGMSSNDPSERPLMDYCAEWSVRVCVHVPGTFRGLFSHARTTPPPAASLHPQVYLLSKPQAHQQITPAEPEEKSTIQNTSTYETHPNERNANIRTQGREKHKKRFSGHRGIFGYHLRYGIQA